MHVYDFITDEFQNDLKEQSRQRPNRVAFETSLERYIHLFMSSLAEDNLVGTGDSTYLHPHLASMPEVQKWLLEYRSLFLSESENIREILKEILEIYRVFIRGKQHNAVLRFHDLLDRFNLLDKVDWELLGGFFRCRWYGESDKDQKNEEEFFYHIPFSKRYLISNQRFSVSGIPLLYLGASLSTACFEIGQEDLDGIEAGNLAISFWGFNPAFRRYPGTDFRAIERINIFDISNLAYDIFNDVIMDVVLEKEDDALKQNVISNYTFLNRESIRIAIRKFALSQVCTFVTDKFKTEPSGQFPGGKLLNNFYEEYVIPQLLTEAVRLHKYDGIIYPSTKYSTKKISSTTGWISGAFKTNLAMFSSYNSLGPYDLPLVKNFVIDAKGKKILQNDELLAQVSAVLNDIELHNVFIERYTHGGYFSQRIRAVLRYCRKRLRLYQVLQIDGKNFMETQVGNIELQLIVEYTKFIMTELRLPFHEEFDRYTKDIAAGKYNFPWLKSSRGISGDTSKD